MVVSYTTTILKATKVSQKETFVAFNIVVVSRTPPFIYTIPLNPPLKRGTCFRCRYQIVGSLGNLGKLRNLVNLVNLGTKTLISLISLNSLNSLSSLSSPSFYTHTVHFLFEASLIKKLFRKRSKEFVQ